MGRKPEATFICNNCGEEVRLGARVCRNCGADDETAWSQGASRPIQLTQEDDDFDYDEFVRTEIQGKKPKNKRWWIPVLALILLAVFVMMVLKSMF